MSTSMSFTPRALLALSRTLVAEPGSRLLGLSGTARRPVPEPTGYAADLDDLLGFRAPPHWRGLAIVVGGSCAPGSTRLVAASPERLRVAYALDRAGNEAITVADVDGEVVASSATVAGGYVTDVCRRILGLACEPERRPVAAWVTAQWLTLVLDLVADPATSDLAAGWPLVAELHPGFDPRVAPTPDDLADATVDAVAALPWPVLREQVAEGALHVESVSPALARWMDDAFFARFLVEGCRPVDELLDDLRLFLDGDTLELVSLTVDATLGASARIDGWL